jgi:hypothetical protein
MTYYVSAFTNDRARLCVHTMQTNDMAVADMVAHYWGKRGYVVTQSVES